jgi:hypothetical protein
LAKRWRALIGEPAGEAKRIAAEGSQAFEIAFWKRSAGRGGGRERIRAF